MIRFCIRVLDRARVWKLLRWHCQQQKFQHTPTQMLARLAGTSARSLARPRAAPLASFLRHGSSQTIRSSAALIDPAVLARDQAKPVLSTDKIDAMHYADCFGRFLFVTTTP